MKEVRTKLYGDVDPYQDPKLVLMKRDLQGFNSTSEVFEQVISECNPKLILEVGTWKGASAVHMAKTLLNKGCTDFEIVCIDTWLGSEEHWTRKYDHGRIYGRPDLYEQFLSNIIDQELCDYITPFPIDSVNAAEVLKKFEVLADMIYIDAGHDYYSVRLDLILYSALLRDGGYLLGDDWFHEPIQRAAYEAFGQDKVIVKATDKFLWVK